MGCHLGRSCCFVFPRCFAKGSFLAQDRRITSAVLRQEWSGTETSAAGAGRSSLPFVTGLPIRPSWRKQDSATSTMLRQER